jgi:hypothetical protein
MTFLSRSVRLMLSLLLMFVLLPVVRAQDGPLDKSEPKGITVDEIVKRFTAKEKEFKEALDQYTYRQDVRVQTLDGDTVDGEFREVFEVSFDEKGRKIKNMVLAPQPTLTRIGMTREDYDDLENLRSFTVTSDEVSQYDLLYVGRQQEDELQTYVFDIAPKQIEKGKRYFQGRVWVDDQDFQIVKSFGKSVPETHLTAKGKGTENLFPKFTTWRERIDGRYWFPTFSRGDDTLHFHGGRYALAQDVQIRDIVKYTNYKRFGSKVTITYQGEEVKKADPKQPPDKPQEKPE